VALADTNAIQTSTTVDIGRAFQLMRICITIDLKIETAGIAEPRRKR
jgi:hypothetical protein